MYISKNKDTELYKRNIHAPSGHLLIWKNFGIFIPKSRNQFCLVVIFVATFDVEINSGYLKKTDDFLSQNANLMVSIYYFTNAFFTVHFDNPEPKD